MVEAEALFGASMTSSEVAENRFASLTVSMDAILKVCSYSLCINRQERLDGGRPMSQSDFRSWTRTLKLVCFVML